MCCFTRPVKFVSGTRIFARADEGGGQFLVYSMTIKAEGDLAMVLPLPVKPGTSEKGVAFINLEDYPDFFRDLEKGFPVMVSGGMTTRGLLKTSDAAPKLEVVQVGSFEASFVPTVKDFSRLDEKFRLPEGTWKKLPDYRDYGFAVFKLRKGSSKVHPMAFLFPRRDKATLFFPTVHIHDGKVHPKAGFDHVLYCQPRDGEYLVLDGWRESIGHARSYMNLDKTRGTVLPDQHCYQTILNGNLPNHDTLIAVQS